MEFEVLGPVRLRGSGDSQELTGRMRRTLLSVLLAHANQPVSVGTLVGAIWGEDATSGHALQLRYRGRAGVRRGVPRRGQRQGRAPSNSLVSYVIGQEPQLEIAGVEDAGSRFVDFELGGTVEGKPVTIGGVAVRVAGDGSPCVFTFNAG